MAFGYITCCNLQYTIQTLTMPACNVGITAGTVTSKFAF